MRWCEIQEHTTQPTIGLRRREQQLGAGDHARADSIYATIPATREAQLRGMSIVGLKGRPTCNGIRMGFEQYARSLRLTVGAVCDRAYFVHATAHGHRPRLQF